ncbi:hypothetical protein [Caballeronia sp. LZ016]|uniref:hypothetical protein n=1 Tax=Caballeronia sp. LZ016 TaxID=3038554 RepID=UPI00285A3080|nr:hypothetical protein [Caballeronia sp. LZ016]MDR5737716.1 hypothetical protein [Caballeronia sp. LZ016]
MKHELRAALMPLMLATLMASPLAHAGNFADAAITKQAGGGAPSEMDLLGSPDRYADPYGAPVNGKGGQRGPITNAQTAQGVSPTDKLLAQQNGYAGNPGARAQLRRVGRNPDAKAMMMPQGAAATLYRTPDELKPPARAARPVQIYKSPY